MTVTPNHPHDDQAQPNMPADEVEQGREATSELPFDNAEFGTSGFFPHPDSAVEPDAT